MKEEVYKIDTQVKPIVQGESVVLAHLGTGHWLRIPLSLFNQINIPVVLSNVPPEYSWAVSFLIEKQFLRPEGAVQQAIDIRRAAGGDPITPLAGGTVHLHVTQQCNLSCLHCYSTDFSNSSTLNLNDIAVIGLKLRHANVRRVVLTGGEPFIHPNITCIMRILKNCGIPELAVTTNAVSIQREHFNAIVELVDNLIVSLDGPCAEIHDMIRGVGTFKRTINSIMMLKQEGYERITIKATVNEENMDSIPEMILLAKQLGVTFDTNICSPLGRAAETGLSVFRYNRLEQMWKQLLSQCVLHNHPLYPQDPFYYHGVVSVGVNCGAGIGEIAIASDGNMYPCIGLMNERWRLGSAIIGTASLVEEIAKSEIYNTLTSMDVDQDQTCSKCDVRYFCSGGCLAIKYTENSHDWEDRCRWLQRSFRCRVWKWDDSRTLAENIQVAWNIDDPSVLCPNK